MTFICTSLKAKEISEMLNAEKNPNWNGRFYLGGDGYTILYSKEIGAYTLNDIRNFALGAYASIRYFAYKSVGWKVK